MAKDFNGLAPWGQLARCVQNPDLSVAYFLDKDNSNLKSDGTEVDWQEVENLGQNVMVQIPKFYYSKKKVNDDFIFGVSEQPTQTDLLDTSDWEVHHAFFRDRSVLCDDQNAIPTELDYRYVGAFHGWVDGSGRLRSLPNKKPSASINIGNFRNHAKNMGVGWSQLDYYLLYALQMLYITEYGHPDSQTMIGRGYVDGNSAAINTGGTMQYGNNTFGETTGKQQISYRGIEDFWGNVYNWIDGYYLTASGVVMIGNKGYNNTGIGYESLGTVSTVNGNIRRISDIDKMGFTISSAGATYTTGGLYDYGHLDVASGGRIPFFGGIWSNASYAGAFQLGVAYSASYSYAYIGARLCS